METNYCKTLSKGTLLKVESLDLVLQAESKILESYHLIYGDEPSSEKIGMDDFNRTPLRKAFDYLRDQLKKEIGEDVEMNLGFIDGTEI